MAREIEGVAEALFEKIRARFEGVSVGDEHAKSTTDPTQARFFNFDFIDKAGNNFGNVTVSLINEESLKVYFGKNLSADLDEEQKAEWYDFLRDLRMFAMRNLLKFDTRDISRSQLDIKDIQQQAKVEKPATIEDNLVAEGKLYGTSKTSYESIAPGTRLIIRHSAPVDEAIQGSRGRKIHAVYIEDAEGQRFKSPFTNLLGSRALARHIANGGQINDDFSKHVSEMCEEMGKIRNFIKGSRNKTFEDAEANEMVGAAKDRYQTLHQMLGKLKNPRGYKFYKENWKPAQSLQDDIDLEELKGKFVLKDFDDRLEAALPHVYKAYHAMKNKPAVETHVAEFEESLDKIAEGTWSVPDNDLAVKKLQDLMADVLPAGIDGADATGALYDILGDDELFDDIYNASKGSPEMDVRPIIYDWLQSNMPSVFEKVKGDMETGHTGAEEAPVEEPAPEEQPAQESIVSEDWYDHTYSPEGKERLLKRYGKYMGNTEGETSANLVKYAGKFYPNVDSLSSWLHAYKKSKETGEKDKYDDPRYQYVKEHIYYSVESDSPPFYVHTSQLRETAEEYLKKAHKRGQMDAKIYEIRVNSGKKVKTPVTEAKAAPRVSITESTALTDIRKLAGLK